MKKISVGICCYNEVLNIPLMHKAVTEQMQKLPAYDYEIIFEDNASTDGSQELLRELAKKDRHVKPILHLANFGVERSSYNCMRNATGDAFISIPCDFEEPPELIPDFISGWEEGHACVLGQKVTSDEGRFTYFLRGLYYRIIDFFSDRKQIPEITGFGLYDRSVVDVLLSIKAHDPYTYTRHLLVEYGFDLKLIPYRHGVRAHGTSSYSKRSYLSFAINSLCNSSTKPLRIITLLGLFALILALIGFVVALLLGATVTQLLVVGLLALGSLQVLCTGMLGEYLAVVLRKVTFKPPVIEKELDRDDR